MSKLERLWFPAERRAWERRSCLRPRAYRHACEAFVRCRESWGILFLDRLRGRAGEPQTTAALPGRLRRPPSASHFRDKTTRSELNSQDEKAYALRPLLISLSLTSAEMPAKLTALLAAPYGPDLDSQMSALALQKAVVQDAADKSAIHQLLGESSESMTTKIQTSLDEISDLRGYRDALLSSGDSVRIARFRQLAAESGEIEALQQLRRE